MKIPTTSNLTPASTSYMDGRFAIKVATIPYLDDKNFIVDIANFTEKDVEESDIFEFETAEGEQLCGEVLEVYPTDTPNARLLVRVGPSKEEPHDSNIEEHYAVLKDGRLI